MDPEGIKYFNQRYRLFSRYDEGIELDHEAWYSVTPEAIAKHIANKTAELLPHGAVILDGFCGAGGNTIQFALSLKERQLSPYIFAIDIDPKKIEIARNNARVYGVDHLIEFILGDYFVISPLIHVDLVFLSPPWGGPGYINEGVYDIQSLKPLGGKELISFTMKNVSKNIVLCLPRNINPYQIVQLTEKYERVEIEYNCMNRKVKTITCYFNKMIEEKWPIKEVYTEEDILW